MEKPKYCELQDTEYTAELLALQTKQEVDRALSLLTSEAEIIDQRIEDVEEDSGDSIEDILPHAREVVARINSVMGLAGDNLVNDWLIDKDDKKGAIQVALAGIGPFLQAHDPEFQSTAEA